MQLIHSYRELMQAFQITIWHHRDHTLLQQRAYCNSVIFVLVTDSYTIMLTVLHLTAWSTVWIFRNNFIKVTGWHEQSMGEFMLIVNQQL